MADDPSGAAGPIQYSRVPTAFAGGKGCYRQLSCARSAKPLPRHGDYTAKCNRIYAFMRIAPCI